MLQVQVEQKIYKLEEGSLLSPKGFSAGGVHAGLRHAKKDVGVVVSEKPASCAAVYTQNVFQAAPLKVTRESIAEEKLLQAIIVNSANANACTGEQGLKDAYEMRQLTAHKLSVPEHYVAVASTGVIGEMLPMEKVRNGILDVTTNHGVNGAEDFQTAILTTDTIMKKSCYQFEIDGQTVTIGGAAKGSGMIHPNMATMLGFVTTDANIDSESLQGALRSITDNSFNQITVDGDTSTNDMVLVMANGMAGNEALTTEHKEWSTFYNALQLVCEDLARQIAKDGEGATKLIEVNVTGAATKEDANKVAKSVIGSNLVKSAVFGSDANWGRVLCAIGYSGADLNPETVHIALGPITMLENSTPQPFDEEEATKYLENSTVVIYVNLHNGEETGKAWGCDLTYDYVKINASYRT